MKQVILQNLKTAVAQLILKKEALSCSKIIIAFVLLGRIQKVTQNLISHDQTAYIKED